jgi:hypothetical protein
MNNKKMILILGLAASVLLTFLTGCDDSGQTPTAPGGGSTYIPTIRIHQGARYNYTNDSLINNNGVITTQRTRIGTYDVVNSPVSKESQLCYPILSTSYDTNTTLTSRDTLYVRYDSTAGKVYQYGLQQLINPLQPPSWDLVGDFSVARGTQWTIGTINLTFNFPSPIGTVNFTGPLTGKVADSTTINTTSTPSTIVNCYRIELNASVTGSTPLGNATASILIDYYLGYYSDLFPNNPSGLVRITFRPFSFDVSGIPVLYQSGVDRILMDYTP